MNRPDAKELAGQLLDDKPCECEVQALRDFQAGTLEWFASLIDKGAPDDAAYAERLAREIREGK